MWTGEEYIVAYQVGQALFEWGCMSRRSIVPEIYIMSRVVRVGVSRWGQDSFLRSWCYGDHFISTWGPDNPDVVWVWHCCYVVGSEFMRDAGALLEHHIKVRLPYDTAPRFPKEVSRIVRQNRLLRVHHGIKFMKLLMNVRSGLLHPQVLGYGSVRGTRSSLLVVESNDLLLVLPNHRSCPDTRLDCQWMRWVSTWLLQYDLCLRSQYLSRLSLHLVVLLPQVQYTS